MFACVHKRKRLSTQTPVCVHGPTALPLKGVYQLIKKTSVPIKRPIKRQGGEAHLDGSTSLDS